MHQIRKSTYVLRTLTSYCFLILLTVSSAAWANNSERTIVVTIKPLYSLVAHLTEGIETPVLLMNQAQSPHHYNMRPSERRLLANAKMIVWIGPQMESYLNKVIQQQPAVKVQATQSSGINLLVARTADKNHHSDHSSDYQSIGTNIDPHIWLSPNNAVAISKHITEQLILNDSINSNKYSDNLEKLIIKIRRTSEQTTAELKSSTLPFIAYHDAFQYFENEYNLNYIDAIVSNEETGVSLKRLSHIKDQIKKNNIQCMVFQAPKPDIIDTITNQTSIKTVALDPLGLSIKDNKDAWFEIIQQITLNFKHCLTP